MPHIRWPGINLGFYAPVAIVLEPCSVTLRVVSMVHRTVGTATFLQPPSQKPVLVGSCRVEA
jgi:hypothetical protein